MPVIMVVEDDPDLQHLIEDALVEGGFDTEMLTSGEEGLTLFQRDRTKYSALVTDINLNGTMTGWDVARQIREAVPDFPVVYMTGAAGDDWGSQGVPTSILAQQALRTGAASDGSFATPQCQSADGSYLDTPPIALEATGRVCSHLGGLRSPLVSAGFADEVNLPKNQALAISTSS